MALRPTNPAARPTRTAGQQSSSSGITTIQVDQKAVAAGDVLLDWRSNPVRHIRVDQIEIGAKDIRTLTGVDQLTGAPVTLTWSYCLSYVLVLAGPKFDQVQQNPSVYRQNQGRRIWQPVTEAVR